jgi:putative NIF3 family GTP cyclohydrolase 1 type 2
VGEKGKRHQEEEARIESIFPAHLSVKIVRALKAAHPYEEPAFDIYSVEQPHPETGSGVIGQLETEMAGEEFLGELKRVFKTPLIRHSRIGSEKIRTVAVCGGAGSFLITKALKAGADAFVTADLKYHEFFDANDRLLLADIGHYESEQFTIDLIHADLAQKFPNFAVLKTGVITNPVHYF